MTDRLTLREAVVAAGGKKLTALVPSLDLEFYLDNVGEIDQEKVADLVDTLLPEQKPARAGREAGLAAARERWPAPPDTTEVNSTVKTSKAREAGLAEAHRRFGTPS